MPLNGELTVSQTESKPIDPGAEFSRPREGKLPFIIGWVERHPACTLAGGEADLLVKEIRRLEKALAEAVC